MILGSIVLTGGRSARMGRPKESLPFRGSTLLGHVVDTLLSCAPPVVVVARDRNQPLPDLPPQATLAYDSAPDQGPLWGLHAGLNEIAPSCDAAFVTACDAPFLTPHAVLGMANELGDFDMVLARVDGRLQPLGAVYRCDLTASIQSLLDADTHALRALPEHCNARILEAEDIQSFDPSHDLFRSLNTPEAYAAARDKP